MIGSSCPHGGRRFSMFLGWYDPDRKRPAREKLAEALARYEQKFRRKAVACLTSVADADELATDKKANKLPVPVKGVAYIPRHTFYVGVEETPEETLSAAA
jgi:hypothetical protein